MLLIPRPTFVAPSPILEAFPITGSLQYFVWKPKYFRHSKTSFNYNIVSQPLHKSQKRKTKQKNVYLFWVMLLRSGLSFHVDGQWRKKSAVDWERTYIGQRCRSFLVSQCIFHVWMRVACLIYNKNSNLIKTKQCNRINMYIWGLFFFKENHKFYWTSNKLSFLFLKIVSIKMKFDLFCNQ